MGNYHKMLKHYKEKGLFSEAKMWESVENLDEILDSWKEDNPEMFWAFMRKQHEIFCGHHFNEKFALWQVEQMYHKTADGKVCKGQHWTPEDAEEVYTKYKSKLPASTTVWDVYVAVNANYHDRYDLFKDWNPDDCEKMVIEDAIKFYFLDCDWKSEGKVWDYMNANE